MEPSSFACIFPCQFQEEHFQIENISPFLYRLYVGLSWRLFLVWHSDKNKRWYAREPIWCIFWKHFLQISCYLHFPFGWTSYARGRNYQVIFFVSCNLVSSAHAVAAGHSTWYDITFFFGLRIIAKQPINSKNILISCLRNKLRTTVDLANASVFLFSSCATNRANNSSMDISSSLVALIPISHKEYFDFNRNCVA